jgi:hypothetical protein
MWKEGIQEGILFMYELYEDKFPHWWLNKIFGREQAPEKFTINKEDA